MNKEFKTMINGLTWTIRFVNMNDSGLAKGGQADGLTNYNTLEILIADSIPKDKQERILIHELVHAVDFSTRIDQKKTKYDIEEVCEFVSLYMHIIEDILSFYRDIVKEQLK